MQSTIAINHTVSVEGIGRISAVGEVRILNNLSEVRISDWIAEIAAWLYATSSLIVVKVARIHI